MGGVSLSAAGLSLSNGSRITASALAGSGKAGDVNVEVATLSVVDGSQIRSDTFVKADAGTVTINNTGLVEVLNGGQIGSSTFDEGDAGGIRITGEPGRLLVDRRGSIFTTGISSQANRGSSGNAGTVTIGVGEGEVLNGAQISSSTFGKGDAGGVEVTVESGRLLVDGGGLPTSIGSDADRGSSGNAGTVKVILNGGGLLELRNGGQIGSNTFGVGRAGETTVEAGRLLIDSDGSAGATGISSQAEIGSSGNAGRVIVKADELKILDGGSISSSILADTNTGVAGGVEVTVGQLLIDGDGSPFRTAIASDSSSDFKGDTGTVTINATGLVEIRDGGELSTSTFGGSNAGAVTVRAQSLLADDEGNASMFTGIASQANSSELKRSKGDSGTITVIAQELEVRGGAEISTSTFAEGDAGSVGIAAGKVLIDGAGSGVFSKASDEFTGQAGTVTVWATDVTVAGGAGISANTAGPQPAGQVAVTGAKVTLADAGTISSGTTGAGAAGAVRVEASQSLTINGGTIASGSTASGPGGDVFVQAPQLRLQGQGEIAASGTGTGPAGGVKVRAQTLKAEDSGIRTRGDGAEGGRIEVTATRSHLSARRGGDLKRHRSRARRQRDPASGAGDHPQCQ